MGIHALDILDTQLLLSYTMIGHDVYNKTKVLDCQYDLVVKGQGHKHYELVYGSKREYLFQFLT